MWCLLRCIRRELLSRAPLLSSLHQWLYNIRNLLILCIMYMHIVLKVYLASLITPRLCTKLNRTVLYFSNKCYVEGRNRVDLVQKFCRKSRTAAAAAALQYNRGERMKDVKLSSLVLTPFVTKKTIGIPITAG